METMQIVTNNQYRPIIDAYELSEKERQEFDYLDWNAIDQGSDSASFFKYKGQIYDLGEFQVVTETLENCHGLKGWNGFSSDSYFSGVLIKFSEDFESVIVGRWYS